MKQNSVLGLLALSVLGSACIEVPKPTISTEPTIVEQQPDVRRIEVTLDDPETGGTCRVTYPPDPEMKDLRWATGPDVSVCNDIAQEAREAIQAKGWVCEPEKANTLPNDVPLQGEAVWLCLRV